MAWLRVRAGDVGARRARFVVAAFHRPAIAGAVVWLGAMIVMGADGFRPPASACASERTASESERRAEELLASLIREIVPPGRPARPPYLLARYDLALRTAPAVGAPPLRAGAVVPSRSRAAATAEQLPEPFDDPFGADEPDDPFGAADEPDDPFGGPAQPPRHDADPFADTATPRRTGNAVPLNVLTAATIARQRQQRLEELWTELKQHPVRHPTDAQAADLALVKYAFGESTLAEAAEAVRPAGPAARLRLAGLLLAECRFDEALEELAAVASPLGAEGVAAAPGGKVHEAMPDEHAREALALLVAHQLERAALARRVDVVPLRFDLDGHLRRLEADPATRAWIDALRQTAAAHVAPKEQGGRAAVRIDEQLLESVVLLEAEVQVDFDEVEPADGTTRELPTADRRALVMFDDRCSLVDVNRELLLHPRAGWNSGAETTLTLHSHFHGPLRFHLYRFADQEAWEQVDAARLAALEPYRRWTQQFHPISENNVRATVRTIALPGLEEGWYLLTVRARYAPMLGACKFAVNNVALYLHAGRNGGMAVAVDRHTGLPVAGLPLELDVKGTPNFESVFGRFAREHRHLVELGFRAQSLADTTPEAEAARRSLAFGWRQPVRTSPQVGGLLPEHHLRRAEAYLQGVQGRRLYPDHKEVLHLTTGPSGSIEFPLDLGRTDHRYQLAVARRARPGSAGAASRVEVHYQERGRSTGGRKAVVWFAQPIHRPGDTARFRGILRRFDGVHVADHDPDGAETVRVRVVNRNGEVWAGVCELSPAGTIHGEFAIPEDVALGPCWFHVEGSMADPPHPLIIAEFRLPTYEVELNYPARVHAGGEELRGTVEVRYFSGRPADGAAVEAVIEGRGLEPIARIVQTDEHGRAEFRLPLPHVETPQRLPLRVTVMDAAGHTYTAGGVVDCRPGAPEAGEAAEDGPPPAPPADSAKDKSPRPSGSEAAEIDAMTPLSVRFAGDVPDVIDAGRPLECVVRVAGGADRRATLALIAENDRFLHGETLAVGPGDYRFTIATQPDWAPSLRLAAVLLDGRRANRALLEVFLRPTERFLTLSIRTDQDEYLPGGKCTVVVTALDHRGQPVSGAEIGLGVVDEAIYETADDPTPDLFDFFHQYRLPYLCVERYDAAPPPSHPLSFWLGPRYAWGFLEATVDAPGRRSLGSMGATRAAPHAPTPRVRRRFETAAHWVANLVTDREGKAKTTFRLPDGLTRWRFTARGVTPDTKIGQLRVERRTFLPLQVELALPRVVRDGDELELPVMLHNHADRFRIVALRTRIGDGSEQVSRVVLEPKAGRATMVSFPVRGTAPITLFASALDAESGDGDAMERTITPRGRGFRYEQSFSGPLSGPSTLPIDPGVQYPPEGLTLTIRREPGLVGVIESAVGDLIDFPYGCVEQTMSRFMPAILAGRALREAGVESAAAKRLPEVVAQGLRKLQGHQHAGGGWGWWQYDATNDFMTAYVLEGLALCRQSGHDVPNPMLARGQAYLLARLVDDRLQGRRPGCIGQVGLPVYAARALAMVYHQQPERYEQAIRQTVAALERIERADAERSPLDEALLADAWRLVGQGDRAAAMLPRLQGRVEIGRGDRRRTIHAAQVIVLGAALEPDRKHWLQMATRLAAARDGAGWGDTLTSAYAVRALAAVVGPARRADAPVTVLRNNKPLGLLPPMDAGDFEVTLHGPSRVRLNPKSRGGDDFYHARLEGYLERWPNPPEPAVELSLRVSRVLPERTAIEPDAEGRITVPRGVTLEMLVEARLDEPVAHARLTVPRPAGFELVRTARTGGGLAATEERDEAWHFFIDRWDRGCHVLRFLVRAELAGPVTAAPLELAPMYDDSRPTAVFAPTLWQIE